MSNWMLAKDVISGDEIVGPEGVSYLVLGTEVEGEQVLLSVSPAGSNTVMQAVFDLNEEVEVL